MPDGSALLAVLLTVGFVPVLWSALIAVVHWGRAPDQRVEPAVLAVTLAPVALGLLLLALSAAVPASSPAVALVALRELVPQGDVANAARSRADWLLIGGVAAALVYVCGATWLGTALARAEARCRRLAAAAVPFQGFADVRVADMTMPAFVDRRGKIILPRRFAEAMTHEEIALIVAHERAHFLNGDPLRYAVWAWIEVLFWFNPFVRTQVRRCRLAAEIACDAAVVAAAPQMRRAYAAIIVAALKHTAGDALACAPAAVSPRNLGDNGMRIGEIMSPTPRRGKRSGWAAFALAALLALPVGAVQLAYAEAASGKTPFMTVPLSGPVSMAYGEKTDPITGKPRFHDAVDIIAITGTPIVAPAPGRVTRADANLGRYGNYIEIDHGDGLVTRYAHLQSIAVKVGEQVTSGQIIGRVGSSGSSTGPHLHLQVLRDGKAINPAEVFSLYSN